MVLYTYHPSNWEMWEGESEIQGHHQLHSKIKVSLGYMQSFLKNILGLELLCRLEHEE